MRGQAKGRNSRLRPTPFNAPLALPDCRHYQSTLSQPAQEASVGRVRVAGFSLSLDGFGAGPEQSLQDPLGKRGTELHTWFFGTKTFKAMFGQGGG